MENNIEALPLEGEALDAALEQFIALMIALRPNFGAKAQGAAFQGVIMTLGVVFPSHKEALNVAIPSLPVRKVVRTGDVSIRQMSNPRPVEPECPTCGKKVDQSMVAGAAVVQMVKLQTSGASTASLEPGAMDLPAGPVSSDQVGSIITYDGVHGPETLPTDEKWAGLLTTLPDLDSALQFYFTLTGKRYSSKTNRDHISVLKAIHAYNDTPA